jgi:hypothetical protein
MFSEALKVQFNCFLDELDNLSPRLTDYGASRKVWRVCPIAFGAFFILLQGSLLEDI